LDAALHHYPISGHLTNSCQHPARSILGTTVVDGYEAEISHLSVREIPAQCDPFSAIQRSRRERLFRVDFCPSLERGRTARLRRQQPFFE
jgi:hypothetical protein